MSNIIDQINEEQLRIDIPSFQAGYTVKVHCRVIEGNKERVQVFEGIVIAIKNGSVNAAFTVRKISNGVGVERTFMTHSPRIAKIEVTKRGVVRRAKLYYLRNKVGKAAKIKERLIAETGLPVEEYLIGPIIGTSCGPGVVSACWFGEEITIRGDEK